MIDQPTPRPEYSRPVALDRLRSIAVTEEMTADAEERAALARRFGLLGLDRLSATLRLERAERNGLVQVSGRLEADVTQACVVTLDPVRSHLEEDFTLLYSLDPKAAVPETGAPGAGAVVIEPEEDEEPPEPVGPQGIDLGEVVAQQLALALDPYPRVPDAELPREAAAAGKPSGGKSAGTESPFAALEALKRRQ